ncbi:MAG: hypothetical protein WCL51_08985 [Bacteroidota bacterium]
MEKRIAQVTSYLFHPLLMPTYMMAILFNLQTFFSSFIRYEYKLTIIAYVFLITFVFPVVMSFVFLKMKVIQSLQMEGRQERTLPYLSVIIFYYSVYYLMKRAELPGVYLLIFLAIVLLTIVAFFINFKFKISIHSMAIGALTGILIGLSIRLNINLIPILLTTIIVSGLVCFARLALNAHKSSEVYIGYLLGIGYMLLVFYIL